MIYRGPGSLAVLWSGSSPALSPPLPSVSCLSFSVFLCVAGWAYLRESNGDSGGGAKSYDSKKAWSSISHSILFEDGGRILNPQKKTKIWLIWARKTYFAYAKKTLFSCWSLIPDALCVPLGHPGQVHLAQQQAAHCRNRGRHSKKALYRGNSRLSSPSNS